MTIRYRIDVSRCIGCRACEVACVTANDLAPEHSRNWVPHLEEDASATAHTTFAPYLCHHCEEPPCVPACPTGASYIGHEGRVLVDHELCIGCGLCVPACPYDARYVEPATNKLEKCTLCEGRVHAGHPPACFGVCPAGARTYDESCHRWSEDTRVAVGEVGRLDEGHEVMRLTTDTVDPKPRLDISGRPEDLALVRRRRPPTEGANVPSALWRNGVGWAVQGLGLAAAAAMAGMIGLRMIRARRGDGETAGTNAPAGAVQSGDHDGRSDDEKEG